MPPGGGPVRASISGMDCCAASIDPRGFDSAGRRCCGLTAARRFAAAHHLPGRAADIHRRAPANVSTPRFPAMMPPFGGNALLPRDRMPGRSCPANSDLGDPFPRNVKRHGDVVFAPRTSPAAGLSCSVRLPGLRAYIRILYFKRTYCEQRTNSVQCPHCCSLLVFRESRS